MNGLAPDFTLAKVNGSGSVHLDDLRGKVVLVNFWATWCGPCQEEMPDLVSLARDYEAKGLVVVGVAVQSPPDDVSGAVTRFGIPYDIVEGTESVAQKWAVQGIPRTYIIDKEGIIRTTYVGSETRSTFEYDVVKLLGT